VAADLHKSGNAETSMPAILHDNPTLFRFEMEDDGVLDMAIYRLTDNLITFTHTEVPPQVRGHGDARGRSRARWKPHTYGMDMKPTRYLRVGAILRRRDSQDIRNKTLIRDWLLVDIQQDLDLQ
jgi:hypothetical protein